MGIPFQVLPQSQGFPSSPVKGLETGKSTWPDFLQPSRSSFCSHQAQRQVHHFPQGLLARSAKFHLRWRAAACSVSELVWNQLLLQGAFADADREQSLSTFCGTNLNTALGFCNTNDSTQGYRKLFCKGWNTHQMVLWAIPT